LILIGGKKIMDLLGDSGSKVMMRLMGLIVMLIAVEFFFSGIMPYIAKIVEAVR
jgi:multiple antibiotic resistance protein